MKKRGTYSGRPDLKDLADYVQGKLEEFGFRRSDLSRVSGLTHSTINDVYNGNATPQANTLKALAAGLNQLAKQANSKEKITTNDLATKIKRVEKAPRKSQFSEVGATESESDEARNFMKYYDALPTNSKLIVNPLLLMKISDQMRSPQSAPVEKQQSGLWDAILNQMEVWGIESIEEFVERSFDERGMIPKPEIRDGITEGINRIKNGSMEPNPNDPIANSTMAHLASVLNDGKHQGRVESMLFAISLDRGKNP